MKTKKIVFFGCLITMFAMTCNFVKPVKAESSTINARLIISSSLDTDVLKNELESDINGINLNVIEQYDSGMVLAELKGNGKLDNVIQKIESEKGVEFVQEDYSLHSIDTIDTMIPSDSYFAYQWGLHNYGQYLGEKGVEGVDINILPAWELTEGSPDVIIGVLDTGIDITHEDLVNSIYTNSKEIAGNGIDDDGNGYIDDVNGWDFCYNDNSVFDNPIEDLHGTFVSGIIAAEKNTLGICGTAPNVKILPIKFIPGDNGKTSDAIKAIDYASKMGVDIINCSWGGPDYNKALKKAMKHSGILFVCSSGNEGYNVDTQKMYPACFNINNIITVGAIDNKGDWAPFSNYGTDVDVAAPGVNIMSTLPFNSYSIGSGTSFAAPYVTGIAALIKSVKINSTYKEIKKAIVKHTVTDERLIDKVNTSGRVDAYASIKYVIDKMN